MDKNNYIYIAVEVLFLMLKKCGCKGLAKLGNIAAKANVSQFSRVGNIRCGNKFCFSETNNAFA